MRGASCGLRVRALLLLRVFARFHCFSAFSHYRGITKAAFFLFSAVAGTIFYFVFLFWFPTGVSRRMRGRGASCGRRVRALLLLRVFARGYCFKRFFTFQPG